ncbi:GTP pyrophosphokinase family protein [Gordonia sp. 'Campus']|uniref:GTP pyrophosphokinase n=1 Tax=Gordonia sp. 'Campus' TaxID=2915824 RepID=UPI001EE45D85|nr:GTP pyrophosphokinase family protein [Gordonia sp. 'Campus']
MTASDSDSPIDREILGDLTRLRDDMTRFQMEHQFAVDEILTKVTILRTEFLHLHHYNPIEHVTSRVKTPESILRKAMRKGIAPDLTSIRAQLTDIAGIRVTCSFIADTYRILETLTSHDDIRVIEIKDYIAAPKPNGYKSLHAIVAIPVFLSTGPVEVVVELQIRTVAMDFWATLEHKIFYKYDGDVPDHLATELASAARTANELDQRMERLHAEVHGDGSGTGRSPIDDDVIRYLRQHSPVPKDLEIRPDAP